MADKIIESIALTFIDDEFWPVFVFPDHSAPLDFIKQRPKNAPSALPCLVLSRHDFVWRTMEELLDFDPFANYTSDAKEKAFKSASDLQRIKAFKEAMQFHGMDYYHDLARRQERTTRKRALDDHSDDTGDSDFEVVSGSLLVPRKPSFQTNLGLQTPRRTPESKAPNIRKPKAINLTGSDDDEFPDPSTFIPTNPTRKRPRTSHVPVLDHVAQEQLRMMNTEKGDGKGMKHEEKPTEPVQDPLRVNLYVGSDDKLFIVDKKSIERYPNFAQNIVGDDEVGYRIQWDELDETDSKIFESVVEFFNTSDYQPILIGGLVPHLKGVKSIYQEEAAAEKASLLWDMASQFGLEDLQELIRRKIDAQSPLLSNSLLILTRVVYWRPSNKTKVDEEMRIYLKDQICERFYTIMVKDASLLRRVLQGNVELRSYVHGRLAREKDLGIDEVVDEDDEDEYDEDDEEVDDDDADALFTSA